MNEAMPSIAIPLVFGNPFELIDLPSEAVPILRNTYLVQAGQR